MVWRDAGPLINGKVEKRPSERLCGLGVVSISGLSRLVAGSSTRFGTPVTVWANSEGPVASCGMNCGCELGKSDVERLSILEARCWESIEPREERVVCELLEELLLGEDL